MTSKFRWNRAPGWQSSSEEEISDGEYSDQDDERDQIDNAEQEIVSKRARSIGQAPLPDVITSTCPKPTAPAAPSKNRRVNNIWSEVLMEEQLTGAITTSVDIDDSGATTVCRGPETYGRKWTEDKPFTEDENAMEGVTVQAASTSDNPFENQYPETHDAFAHQSVTESKDAKRKRKHPSNTGLQTKHGKKQQQPGHKQRIRYMKKVQLNKDDPLESIARKIAAAVREPKTELILKAVTIIGAEQSIKLYNRTVDLENAGGVMTVDGSRRRTTGGVFLHLVRIDPAITREQIYTLFGQERDEFRKRIKAQRKAQRDSSSQANDKLSAGASAENQEVKQLPDVKEVFLAEALNADQVEAGSLTSSSRSSESGEISDSASVSDDSRDAEPVPMTF